MKILDISEIKKELNDEEKEVIDVLVAELNKTSIPERLFNIAFSAIIVYACFAFLPLWATISLIAVRLAASAAGLMKYVFAAKKLVKNHENAQALVLQIRAKIAKLNKKL